MKHGSIKTDILSFPDGSSQTTALVGGPLDVKNVNGSYTLTSDDISNKIVRIDSPQSVLSSVFLPPNSSVPCPIGTIVIIASNGIGKLLIQGGLGVSVGSPQTTEIERKYGRVVAIKTDTDEWEIDGQLTFRDIIEFNPLNLTTQVFRIDRENFTLPLPSSTVSTSFYIDYTGKELYVNTSSSVGTSYGFRDFQPLVNRQFINVIADKLYFKSNIVTPGLTFNPSYSPADTWFEYRNPSPVGHNNPYWFINQTRSAEIAFTINIDVSETPDLIGYIGSIQYTFLPLQVAVFIQDFSTSVAANNFIINKYGTIQLRNASYQLVDTVPYLNNPSIAQQANIYEGTYFRVNGHQDVTNGNSSGTLGAIYTPDDIEQYEWYNETGSSIYYIEILSDVFGSLVPYATGYIDLSGTGGGGGSGGGTGAGAVDAPGLYGLGSDFNNGIKVLGNSYSDNLTFDPFNNSAVYYKFTIEDSYTVTMESVGSTDTKGTYYTEGQVQLGFNDDTVGVNFGLVGVLTAGTYFLKVEPHNNTTYGDTIVNITFNLVGGGGLYPGDHFDNPILIDLVSQDYRYEYPIFTIDEQVFWFKFTQTYDNNLEVSSYQTPFDIRGTVYDSNGIELNTETGTGGNDFYIGDYFPAGDYYAKIEPIIPGDVGEVEIYFATY